MGGHESFGKVSFADLKGSLIKGKIENMQISLPEFLSTFSFSEKYRLLEVLVPDMRLLDVTDGNRKDGD